MATHKQSYLTCDHCGKLLQDEDDRTVFGETSQEVRDLGEDEGWQCHRKYPNGQLVVDLCPQCCQGRTLERME